jgi:hypothetical protein
MEPKQLTDSIPILQRIRPGEFRKKFPGKALPLEMPVIKVGLDNTISIDGPSDHEATQRALVCFSALVQIFSDFMPTVKSPQIAAKITRDLHSIVPFLIYMSLEDKLEKVMKDSLNGLLALGTGKVSDAYYIRLFPGKLNRILRTKCRYMKSCVNGTGRKACSFLLSLFQSKRCWTAMSANLKLKAREKHIKNFLQGGRRR